MSRKRTRTASPKKRSRGLDACASDAAQKFAPVAGKNWAPSDSCLGPWDWLFVAALVAAVFFVYKPAWNGGFLFDDDLHLLNNPVLRPGGLAKIWVPGGYINYWPLTFTTYWAEYQLWGLKLPPRGFHWVNLAGHAISALLLWRILLQLRAPGARFAAAIFALHPVNVETVAWIAQLKGILSLLFALVSVYFFLSSERRERRWRYALAIGAFLLSTLAKGMVITLPVVLLAIAWWQRGRIAWRDIVRVVPYLLIGAVMAGIEMWTQHLAGAEAAVGSESFFSRMAIAGRAVWFYLGKLVWPVDLCMIYPRWHIDPRNLLVYLPAALLVLLLALAWWKRRNWGRPIVMLLVCYVGLLLPVLGFVNIYFMLYSFVADHYQYAAMIVPCALFAGLATRIFQRLGRRWIGYVLGGALLAVLSLLTWQQSAIYANQETLYRATIKENPECWLAYNNLGFALALRGKGDEAMPLFRKALELRPDYPEAHYNLGIELAQRGEFDKAIAEYRRAIELNPKYIEALQNLGVALASSGKADEAVAEFKKALAIEPAYAEAHYNLGRVLAGRGEVDAAIAEYQKAIDLRPDYVDALNNLGVALASRGQFAAAIVQFQQALKINRNDVTARKNLEAARARLH
jgi:tetratricopeptide (TPR) repeat protein